MNDRRADDIVIQSPMSFVGAARRGWKLTRIGGQPWLKILTVPLALIVILVWWIACAVWLVVFGLLMVPWRLLRRGQRRRKQEAARHREVLDAVTAHEAKP